MGEIVIFRFEPSIKIMDATLANFIDKAIELWVKEPGLIKGLDLTASGWLEIEEGQVELGDEWITGRQGFGAKRNL